MSINTHTHTPHTHTHTHIYAQKDTHQNVNGDYLTVKRSEVSFTLQSIFSCIIWIFFFLEFLNKQINTTNQRNGRDTNKALLFPGRLQPRLVSVLPSDLSQHPMHISTTENPLYNIKICIGMCYPSPLNHQLLTIPDILFMLFFLY